MQLQFGLSQSAAAVGYSPSSHAASCAHYVFNIPARLGAQSVGVWRHKYEAGLASRLLLFV